MPRTIVAVGEAHALRVRQVVTQRRDHAVAVRLRLARLEDGDRIEQIAVAVEIDAGIGLAADIAEQRGTADVAAIFVAGGDWKRTRLNSSHYCASRMPSSA